MAVSSLWLLSCAYLHKCNKINDENGTEKRVIQIFSLNFFYVRLVR